MPKRKHVRILMGQAGVTFMEIMIAMAIMGIVFTAIMNMLGVVGNFAAYMGGQASTVEGVTEVAGILNGVLPQVTRISSCNCRSNSAARSSCIWDSSNPWHDPVRNGGATNPVAILSGEFEAFEGTQALTSMAALTTSNISIPGQTCASHGSNLSAALLAGCKLPFTLTYTAPTAVVGTTPSNAGQLVLDAGATKTVRVGLAASTGANGFGVTELSCGFDSSSGGTVGAVFVLNMKVKTKSNLMTDTTNTLRYESWHPAGLNYGKGNLREVRMKYTMRNISTRGMYFWRPNSIKDCIEIGSSRVPGNASQCCSQAMAAGACIACIRSGQAGTNSSCCSGQATSGACN